MTGGGRGEMGMDPETKGRQEVDAVTSEEPSWHDDALREDLWACGRDRHC